MTTETKKRIVAFDLETDLIQPGLMAPPIVCGSVAGSEGGLLIHGMTSIRETFVEALRSHHTIAGANIAFDMACMAADQPHLLPEIFQAYEEGRVHDVLIAQALDAIAGGHLFKDPRTQGPLKSPSGKQTGRYSLEIVTDLVLGRQDAKVNDFWRLRYAILRHVPTELWPEEARQYPVDDAVNTYQVAVAQIASLRNLCNMKAQARAAFALHLASTWGMRTDPVAVAALEERVEKAHRDAIARFTESGLLKEEGKENIRRIKELLALAHGANGDCQTCDGSGKVPSEKTKNLINCKACDSTGLNLDLATGLVRTETGGISKERDALKESGDELLMEYANTNEGNKKIRETYVPALKAPVINPRPNVLVESGRASYDGLVQLMPQKGGVRECIVPRPGHVFCSIDYAAVELSTLSQCCLWIVGESRMAESINGGKDLHSLFASSMVGMDYDAFKTGLKGTDAALAKKLKGYRQAAKAANFGFPGGMGAPKLVLAKRKQENLRFCLTIGGAEKCGVEKVTEWKGRPCPPLCKRCVELAEELRNSWFQQWPEMKRYFSFISETVDFNGELIQFGSDRVRGGLDFCNGANTLFQGLAADGAKHALWKVSKECYTDTASPMYGARPLIFVHDEIFSEMFEETAHLAAPRMTDVMVEAMKEFVPDVKISAEPALMRKWTKAAEPVWSPEGRLLVWEEKK